MAATGCCAPSPVTPPDLQIMYAVDGARRLPEVDPRPPARATPTRGPVRIGNGAVDQRQHDVLGEVMDALAQAREADGAAADEDAWALQRALVDDLATRWREPDNGLWEIRGEPQRLHPLPGDDLGGLRPGRARDGGPRPARTARAVAGAARRGARRRAEHGFDDERGTFVQHYDTTEVDASLLLLPLVGFIDGDDPRMLGTIEAVEEDLLRDGLVLRYRTETGVDGLSGRRAPVPGLLVLAGLGLRRRRAHRRRPRAVRPAGRAAQRRRAARGGVRPRPAADGRQLPAGLQPPGAGAAPRSTCGRLRTSLDDRSRNRACSRRRHGRGARVGHLHLGSVPGWLKRAEPARRAYAAEDESGPPRDRPFQ